MKIIICGIIALVVAALAVLVVLVSQAPLECPYCHRLYSQKKTTCPFCGKTLEGA